MSDHIRLEDAVLKPARSQPDTDQAVRYEAVLFRGKKPITVLHCSHEKEGPNWVKKWVIRKGEMTYAKTTDLVHDLSERQAKPGHLLINFIEDGKKQKLDLWNWGDGFFQVFEGHRQLNLVDLPQPFSTVNTSSMPYAERMEAIDSEERNWLEWAQAFSQQESLNGEPLWAFCSHDNHEEEAERLNQLREKVSRPDFWFDEQAGRYVFQSQNRDRADHDPMTRFAQSWVYRVEHDPVDYGMKDIIVALDNRAWEGFPMDNPLGSPDLYCGLVLGLPWRVIAEIAQPFDPELHQRIIETVTDLDATCEPVDARGGMMLGHWKYHVLGSRDFYQAIANNIQTSFKSWLCNQARRLGEEIKPTLDAAPWLSWPQEKPIGCPYEWSRLITGREDGWERVLAVLKYAAPVVHEQAVALLEGREPQPVDTLSLQEMADQRTRLRWAREKEEQHQRTVERANATRKRRRAMKLDAVVRQLQKHGALPTNLKKCAICSKALTDPESIKRGIGPECWQGVLTQIEAQQPNTEAQNND